VHVPYKGSPEAVQSVLNGDTCCIFAQVQIAMPQASAGKMKLLGVSTLKRVPAIPDVPTIAEAGLPGFESYTWFGIFAPKGLDPAIALKMKPRAKVTASCSGWPSAK
jgi:tripartite-type tricarboxylate transporter receptor subunit TctC